MSGLLQRLAGQATVANTAGTPIGAGRIRPAASVHAQVPVGTPREEGEPTTGPRLLVDTPGFKASDSQVGNNAPRPPERSRTSTENHSRSEQSLAPEWIEERAAGIESHKITGTAPLSDALRERISHESVARLPEPLLNEVTVANATPAIIPIAPAPVISLQPPDHSRTEPTEVHVHIGRIEVIAATEPVAPKKSRVVGRNTLPLSDYLAKRRQS